MTVAVCFLIAGTTKGARYDILCYRVSFLDKKVEDKATVEVQIKSKQFIYKARE